MLLTIPQLAGLKIGDKVLLKSGMDEYRLEAEVRVADFPTADIWVIVDKITHKGGKVDAMVGERRIAGIDELYLAQSEPLF